MHGKVLILLTAGMVIAGIAPALAQAKGKAPRDGSSAFHARGFGAGLFDRLDANGDGIVTLGEVGARRGLRFDRFDRDGDATVTKAELERVLEVRLDRIRDRILKRFDGNGDGRITRAEYDARAEQRFARFDRDGDGRITRQEFDTIGKDWQSMRQRMYKMGREFRGVPETEKQ